MIGYRWPRPSPDTIIDGCPAATTHVAVAATHLWEAVVVVGLANTLLLGLISSDALVTSRRRATAWFGGAHASIGLAVLAMVTVFVFSQFDCA